MAKIGIIHRFFEFFSDLNKFLKNLRRGKFLFLSFNQNIVISAAKFTESAVENGSNFEKQQKIKKIQNATKNERMTKIPKI